MPFGADYKGRLLIASSKLNGTQLAQTAVLVTHHNKDGAMGLILNRPLNVSLAQVWRQTSLGYCSRDGQLYAGGPTDSVLMVVHPFMEISTTEVAKGLYFSTELDHIRWALQNNEEQKIRFFVGYVDWLPNQLNKQIDEGLWLHTPATPERVFFDDRLIWMKTKRELELFTITGIAKNNFPIDPGVN